MDLRLFRFVYLCVLIVSAVNSLWFPVCVGCGFVILLLWFA